MLPKKCAASENKRAQKDINIGVQRTGFQLTPSFAITDYKSQGLTFQKAYLSLGWHSLI